MTENQKQLWDRISQFEFDNAQIQFNFTDRLARENNWTRSYSKEVIEEYKKFMYLCCTLPNGATPSDQVDQVWHLHLTYTKSYWIDFCKNTLHQEVHHNPTEGGTSEKDKFNTIYSLTKEAYQKVFHQEPPIDIWPYNQERFGEIHFERVNKHRNWIIKKPRFNWKKTSIGLLLIFSTFLGIQATSTENDMLSGWIIGIIIMVIIIFSFRKKGNNSDGSGCSGGCFFNTGCSGDSGCSSGCGGCGGCGS